MFNTYVSKLSDQDIRAINKMQRIALPGDDLCDIIPDYDIWVIIKSDSRYVGFGGIRFLYDDIWYLCRAGIMPKYRGNGLQKTLINSRISAAKRFGAKTIITDCTGDNYGSANSLISCGFKLYKPGYDWALPTSLYWRKDF